MRSAISIFKERPRQLTTHTVIRMMTDTSIQLRKLHIHSNCFVADKDLMTSPALIRMMKYLNMSPAMYTKAYATLCNVTVDISHMTADAIGVPLLGPDTFHVFNWWRH